MMDRGDAEERRPAGLPDPAADGADVIRYACGVSRGNYDRGLRQAASLGVTGAEAHRHAMVYARIADRLTPTQQEWPRPHRGQILSKWRSCLAALPFSYFYRPLIKRLH